MAKFEKNIPGLYDFDEVLDYFHTSIQKGWTIKYVGGSDYRSDNVRCAFRVYDRYTFLASGRVSLSLLLAGEGDSLFVSAVTAGAGGFIRSEEPWGEQEFLNMMAAIAERLTGRP